MKFAQHTQAGTAADVLINPGIANSPWTSSQRWAAVAVAAITITLAFVNLGGGRTLSFHEGYISVTTREMLETKDWIVPHLGGEPRLRKPPLGYWLTALSATCCGELSEFSVRLPSAIASLFLVALVGSWAGRWYGRNAGLCAAFVQATCSVHVIYARQAVIDTLLVLLMTTALFLIAFQPQDEARDRSRLRWLAIYVLLGVTALAKFHFGPTLVFGTAIAWWLVDRRLDQLKHLVNAPGVLLFCILAATWPLIVLAVVPEAILVWRGETVGRILGELTPEPPWFYLLAIPGLFLPWTVFLFWFLLREIKVRWADRDRRERFLIVWVCFQVGIVSLSSNKHDNYVMPMIPALAIYCAPRLSALVMRIVAPNRPIPWSWLVTGFVTTPPVMALLAVICTDRWPTIARGIWILTSSVSGLVCMTLALMALRRHTGAMLTGVLAFLIMAAGLFGWLQPARDYRLPTTAFLKRIRQRVPAKAEVCVYGLGQSPELFYIDGPNYRMENGTELRKQVIETGEMLIVTHRYNLDGMRQLLDVQVLDTVSSLERGFDRQRTPPLMLLRARPKPEAIAILHGVRRRE